MGEGHHRQVNFRSNIFGRRCVDSAKFKHACMKYGNCFAPFLAGHVRCCLFAHRNIYLIWLEADLLKGAGVLGTAIVRCIEIVSLCRQFGDVVVVVVCKL